MPQSHLVMISKNTKLSRKCLQLGTGIANQLDLRQDQVISFYIGVQSTNLQIKIKTDSCPPEKFSLHPDIMKAWGLEETREYGIRSTSNSIHLGPLIGIMADKSDDPQRLFAGQSLFISQLISEGRRLGAICFGFSCQDVNLSKGTIKGYSYSNNIWKAGIYKLPNVIYPRQKAHSNRQNELRKILGNKGCQFLNPPLLGKWESYKILSQNSALQQYLPDTRLLSNFRQVEAMIKSYRAVYLKPANGMQGKRIIRVSKPTNSKSYQYQYQMNDITVQGTAKTLVHLERRLKRIMANKTYIVQQQIKLLKIKNSIADMRIMVQKNEEGKWEITGKAFRIGKAGSITSNISRGGRGCQVNSLLGEIFNDTREVDRIIEEADLLALRIAQSIEPSHSPIGELGIDIGVDQNGRLWFIEANLKPARQVFSLIGEAETRLLTVQKPILYARYLAGF